jgi:hypothetical protein
MFPETASHWPPLLTAPPLVLLLWWVAVAVGHRVLRTFRLPLDAFSIWERGLVCVAVGAGFIQYLPYTLAAFGQLNPRALAVAFSLLTLAVASDLLRTGRALLGELRRLSLKRCSSAERVWLALFVTLMALLLANALTLGFFGSDDDGYHLAAPKRWLESGTLHYLPSYTNTNASLGFEMLYVLGVITGNPGVKIIHYCAGLFTLLALTLSARRLGNRWAALCAVSLVLVATPVCNVPALMSLAHVDFGASLLTMASVLVWLVWRERGDGRLLIVMALCAGFAASFKSTALAVAVAWTPVLIWEARHRGLAWRPILTRGAGLGALAVLPTIPWLFRTWQLTGNPIYPMLSSLIPTRDWNPELARVFGRFFRYYCWGIVTGSNLSELRRKEIVDGTALLVLVMGGWATLRLRDRGLRLLAAFATGFLLILVLVAGMLSRYWLPGELCAVLVLTCWASQRWPAVSSSSWLPCTVLAAALAVELARPSGRTPRAVALQVATGMKTHEQAYASEGAWQMWHFINDNTARDEHILIGAFYTTYGAGNYMCFWLERTCYTTDTEIQGYIDLRDWQSFRSSLNKANISYLLMAETEAMPKRYGFTFTAGKNEYPFCRRLADEYGQRVAQFGVMQLYRIRPEAATAFLPAPE